ncbi:hypothetical protein SAMN04515671_0603 [Nakamurella panacisegetis]|uniref:DUF2255 family protein n=1 Tax=Nakamurella panacisegetis TaxID=1090615 RepID=A0A1H0IQA3_9ACTN|nr:DUF2255 family protein [Nakamurella panacisegetis]SDO33627.1 hypothetical protein SAMN04515671_0603 [Nakamurella panacisegetis]
MTTWTTEDLTRIGDAEELQIASHRPDGTLRAYVTIWVVRADDELYVRSAHGPENPWYRRAVISGTGRIRAGGVERDVLFDETGHHNAEAIDAEFHRKYDRYGPAIVDPVVGPEAARTTIRLGPN